MEESAVWMVMSVCGKVGRVMRCRSISVTWSMGEGIAETFVIMRAMVVIGEDYKI